MALTDAQIDGAARLLSALGEPSRLRIVRVLWHGPAPVSRIVEESGLRQSNVSKQLALLLDAGVVSRRKEGTSAIYAIALPIVRDLCALVCEGARLAAQERHRALTDAQA